MIIFSGVKEKSRADSCPNTGQEAPTGTAAVRCCDLFGNPNPECITPFSFSPVSPCINSATYEEAKEKCTSIGMRLCTPSELASEMCCNSDDLGCNSNELLTWQGKEIVHWNTLQIV